MAAPWSLKRSFSNLSCVTCVRCSDARARRARRSALRRRAQPSNKEGLEDPTLETPLKDTGLPPSPPAPPIDGRTLFDLEVALTIAKGLAPDEDLHEALLDHMKAEAEVSPEGLADKTTTDKTSPILNDLGPVALPRFGKKERFSKPSPRHCQAGRRARPHQYLSKPNNCGCCVGTCELCNPPKPQWSLTSGIFFIRDARGVCRFRLLQTRTWPSAPIPSATGRPQMRCTNRTVCGVTPGELESASTTEAR